MKTEQPTKSYLVTRASLRADGLETEVFWYKSLNDAKARIYWDLEFHSAESAKEMEDAGGYFRVAEDETSLSWMNPAVKDEHRYRAVDWKITPVDPDEDGFYEGNIYTEAEEPIPPHLQ